MPDSPALSDSLTSTLRQIDQVCDRFEQKWHEDDRPQISCFLDEVPSELRLQLLAELVLTDLEHRIRNKLSVTLEDYFREYPELSRLSAPDRAELEANARQQFINLSLTQDHVQEAASKPICPPSIGRYPIVGCLGSGGQADVYLSFHPELLVPVVVKWQLVQSAQDDDRRQQLVREGRALASLAPHPNLVRIFDLGFHEDRPFLVLEYLSGITLEQHAQDIKLTPRQAVELVIGLAEGVQAAHEQGAIHQDINPRNVVLDGLGKPRLIDFGLAWFRSSWSDLDSTARPDGGTLLYLSPEQADPRISAVGRRTDVFGLGAVLYYLLTGRALYNGPSAHAVFQQASNASYDLTALKGVRIPKRLATVCRKTLSRDPQNRYATAGEFADALATSIVQRPYRRVAALFAGLFIGAIACGWLVGQWVRNRANHEIPQDRPTLEVRVWRPATGYIRLVDAVPVKTGDQLQVQFRVSAGLHVSLFSINGHGRLSILQQYPAQDNETKLAYPGANQTRSLDDPQGTEGLLLLGRMNSPVSETELQAAWDGHGVWPKLNPSQRLLRLNANQVMDEGVRSRDFGPLQDHPDSDTIARRLDELRERLKQKCPLLEGLAFSHE